MNGNTIVVVEDEDLLRENAREVFASAGLDVVVFEDGEGAREFILSNRQDIGGLFTDVVLPGALDGLQLARTVAEFCPHIAIVVTSGRLADAPDLPGKARFLAKPWGAVDVLNAMIDFHDQD